MAPIGFSTGSLALGNFRLGLQMVEGQPAAAIELSALREDELAPLVEALDDLDLRQFSYIAVHAPSRIQRLSEEDVVEYLDPVWRRGWSIVVHPDTIVRPELWRRFGSLACIENMDKRKRAGRTTLELHKVFEAIPEASLCFDVGHARQVDPTMCEAELMLMTFRKRIRQVHLSAVSSQSVHEPLNYEAMLAFQQIAHRIPPDTPIILETPVSREGLVTELRRAEIALCRRR
jgi:hypothetical protein